MNRTTQPSTTRRPFALATLIAALTVSLTACGAAASSSADSSVDVADDGTNDGTNDGANDGEVASLGTVAADDSATSADASDDASDDDGPGEASEADMQQAALDFARCMREHGVEMDDPQFSPDGGGGMAIAVGGPGQEIDPEQMEAAQTACEPIMEEIRSSFEPPDPEQLEEMKQEALEFSQCMREHGIDMPDPQFGENGEMTVAIGGPPGEEGDDSPPPIDADEFNEAAEACGGPGGGMVRMGAPGTEEASG